MIHEHRLSKTLLLVCGVWSTFYGTALSLAEYSCVGCLIAFNLFICGLSKLNTCITIVHFIQSGVVVTFSAYFGLIYNKRYPRRHLHCLLIFNRSAIL